MAQLGTSQGTGQIGIGDSVDPSSVSGTVVVAKRDDVLSTVSESEGQGTPLLSDSKGALWVRVSSDAGFATEATLQSILTDLNLLSGTVSGGKILTTETSASAIKTAVEIIDNFISGSRGLVTEDNSAAILAAIQGTLTISGTVTANAGTNLNTSLLALESGGNLATIAGKDFATQTTLALIKAKTDNLDVGLSTRALESGGNLATLAGTVTSSRVATNPISGQAGVAAGVGASGVTTQRVVQANDSGKTISSASGSCNSNGDNTIVSAGSNKTKVFAFSLSTTSTTEVTCKFTSGAGGTELWRVDLQAPTSVSTGANLVVQPPSYLFSTASATALVLNISSGQTIHYSVSYFDES